MTPPELASRIAHFYDQSSGLWERAWGEHMHHGYYGPAGNAEVDHIQAQVDMVERLLAWGEIDGVSRALDAGCGVGGSARHLAKKYGCSVAGITLSPVQHEHAEARTRAAGLDDRVSFAVADALTPPFPAASFDLIWSMESGEHFADKAQFLNKSFELLQPGGKLLMATWCHRNTPPALDASEQALLKRIYRDYHLPYVISIDDYADLARKAGFHNVRTEDWTEAVSPFWKAVIRSALTPQNIWGILRAGPSTWVGALAMRSMVRGYQKGILKFGVLVGEKR